MREGDDTPGDPDGTAAAPSPGRVLGRRRRANVPGGRQHRHVVKVSPQEEAELAGRAAAQRVSVPRLLIESALADRNTPAARRAMLVELFELKRTLTGAAVNLNQLAHHANAEGRLGVGSLEGVEEIRGLVGRVSALIGEVGEG